jgi:hypothetical protein
MMKLKTHVKTPRAERIEALEYIIKKYFTEEAIKNEPVFFGRKRKLRNQKCNKKKLKKW